MRVHNARRVPLPFFTYWMNNLELIELELAQEAYNDASSEERLLQKDIEDINRKMKVDYGQDESFAKLVDQCFEFRDREYTYSVCLFGDAVQKSASSDTSLG